MHLPASIANGSFTLPVIAPTGQNFAHLEQPLQSTASMRMDLSFWQLPAGQRLSRMCASYSSRKYWMVLTTGSAADLPRPLSMTSG
jgi:hypothetical protein